MPLPIPGLQASKYAGVAPMFHGVICGDLAVGEPAAPKNIPVPDKGPPIMPGPMTLVGISIPNLHFSASNIKSKLPVPKRGSLPRIRHSLTPLRVSTSACEEASISTSTVSSKEHLMSAPTSCRLIPCLVMAIR